MTHLKSTFAVLGTLLAATTTQVTSSDACLAGSNGLNMPLSQDVVPSEIKPQEPIATGGMKGHASPGERSRPQDIRRSPVRPPLL
jgi:hypothetical protein